MTGSCAWCQQSVASTRVHTVPTCQACADGGRAERVRMSLGRWRRGADRMGLR